MGVGRRIVIKLRVRAGERCRSKGVGEESIVRLRVVELRTVIRLRG